MMDTATLAWLAAFFFLIAALYSSVGFGGGSSYLAILILYLKDTFAVKTTGLLCNLVVVSGGSYLFGRKGFIDWKRFLPVVMSGVPLAFYGATIQLKEVAFFVTLGGVLCGSGVLMLLQLGLQPNQAARPDHTPVGINMLLGAGTGFLAGLVGIGGGILLSPVLNLMRWDSPKKIAALASFFILVNSIAGLAGQLFTGSFKVIMPMLGVLLAAVFIGGQLGTRISLSAVKPALVKGLTAVLVCYIGAKQLLKHQYNINI